MVSQKHDSVLSSLPHDQFVLTVKFQNYGCCCQFYSVGHGVCPCNWIHHLDVELCPPRLYVLVDWRNHSWICVPSVGKDAQWKSKSPGLLGRSNHSLWYSYHRHIDAFATTVPLPPCVKSSSNPCRQTGGATRHHMHRCYPLLIRSVGQRPDGGKGVTGFYPKFKNPSGLVLM